MSRGGHCDMLGGRGNTEDGPGTLTGTHPRRTEHTHVAAAVLRRAGPGAGPGAGDVSAHGRGSRSCAQQHPANTRTHGAGERLLPKNGMGHGSFIHHEANFGFFSFLHPLRFH